MELEESQKGAVNEGWKVPLGIRNRRETGRLAMRQPETGFTE